jgi:putative hydrolase of HD superfamily
MDPGTIELVRRALALKDVARKGWLRVGVERPESVADHSWGVALLAIAAAPAGMDRARLLELAITHDLCEVATGDLVPGDYADRAEKLSRERAGLETLVETAPLPLRRLLMDRFEELATDASPEARLVHELDKLEMAFQAERYAARGIDRERLADFHESAARAIRDPHLSSALSSLADNSL